MRAEWPIVERLHTAHVFEDWARAVFGGQPYLGVLLRDCELIVRLIRDGDDLTAQLAVRFADGLYDFWGPLIKARFAELDRLACLN